MHKYRFSVFVPRLKYIFKWRGRRLHVAGRLATCDVNDERLRWHNTLRYIPHIHKATWTVLKRGATQTSVISDMAYHLQQAPELHNTIHPVPQPCFLLLQQ